MVIYLRDLAQLLKLNWEEGGGGVANQITCMFVNVYICGLQLCLHCFYNVCNIK